MLPLSVVVTVVDGSAAVGRCLAEFAAERDAVPFELVVPWDSTVSEVAELAPRFPQARFPALGTLPTARSATSASGRHELIDRRRAAGLAAARGELVALVEDRGAPRPGWARRVLEEHAKLPHAVIGGAVEISSESRLAWANYLADFGRYRPPFAPGPRAYLTDVNVSYKRRALDATRELWRDRYHETTVHWALTRAGETLYLSDRFAVEQRPASPTLAAALAERFASGRLFAATRARESRRLGRAALAALSPALPALIVARSLRRLARNGAIRPPRGSLAALALLATAWSSGELVGYVTGDG